ncbi:hypothetical protein ACHQM5_004040 [Ranunculus cassubicifolius]
MAKKALLVGCNYPGTAKELDGCVNDVHRMHSCLVDRFGFKEDDITILIDTDNSYTQPTGVNIRKALSDLVQSAESGGYLFFHYSGHGLRLPAETGDDDDTGYDECIVPTDWNFILDDDFRAYVDQVPEDCRITIVSDSCNSGGLIEEAKEQIGDSYSKEEVEVPSFKSFIGKKPNTTPIGKKPNTTPVSRGLHLVFRPRSLQLSELIEILKEKTGKDNIDVGNLRAALFDVFGEDASPKVKKFMSFVLTKLQNSEGSCTSDNDNGEIKDTVCKLAQEFLKQKMDENDEDYIKPAVETSFESKQEVFAGSTKQGKIGESGVLISGCQSDQESWDMPQDEEGGKSYGALSNAIQIILAESDGPVSNSELVLKARKMMVKDGLDQEPGLYCSDKYVDEPFVC